MDKLVAALKQRYRSPQDVLEDLGFDTALLEEVTMPKITRPGANGATGGAARITPAGLVARGALFTYLYPRLAADSKQGFDFTALVNGVTSKNYGKARDVIANRVATATKGKLAADAQIEDLARLLDALQPEAESADQMGMPPGAAPPPAAAGAGAPPMPPPGGGDDEPGDTLAKIKAYLEQEGVSPDIINNLDAFMSSESSPEPAPPQSGDNGEMCIPGQDDDLDPRGAEENPLTEDEEEEEDKTGEDEVIPSEQEELMLRNGGGSTGAEDRQLVTRSAMDKAIKVAQDRAIKNQRAIRDAERFVRPWVGDLAMDASSPADVYRATLKMLGVKGHENMHADALRPVLEAQPKPTQSVARDRQIRRLAQDAKVEGGFFDRFPDANKVRMQ